MRAASLLFASLAVGCSWLLAAEPPPGVKPSGPLSPREEQATFKLPAGFKVELAAAEPEVIDPVAMAFDEDGRLFVVELRGYPNAGVGEGKPNQAGRVRLLEDMNGDGYFEKATTFIDNLRFSTGVCVWNGGLYVADAPDLLYCKDTDGDGKADSRQVVFTGFGVKNIQQLLNGLQFQFDNFIHGCNGSNDSVVSMDKGRMREDKGTRRQGDKGKEGDVAPLVPLSSCPPVQLRGRHFRFKPGNPDSFEPTSGGGQYGLASDDWGNWFTCTNSQHLRHIVLPDHYLKRNPHLPVPAVVTDIPDGSFEHTAAAKVFRLSPFEAWRVERTSRRVKDRMRLPTTELVPGGYITSATGLTVYRGGKFPPAFDGNIFVGDPANNLVHRDVLLPVGATFLAKRHESERDCEFLASTDNWFRPVFLSNGPDGSLYVCDFYREIIETPLSLPEDIQKQYNLNSRARGRLWRVYHEDRDQRRLVHKPQLSKATNEDLVEELANPNAWWRLTAQRLLIERKAKEVRRSLESMVHTHPDKKARLHALRTLQGLGALEARTVLFALRDQAWQVREQALAVAEAFLDKDPSVRRAVLTLVNDPAPRVRFQLAFTLGEMKPNAEAAAALASLVQKDGVSPWVQSAILSSALPYANALIKELAERPNVPSALLARLAGLIAASGDDQLITETLVSFMRRTDSPAGLQCELVAGLAQGLARRGRPLPRLLADDPPTRRAFLAFAERARGLAEDQKAPMLERQAALRVLCCAPPDFAVGTLKGQLAPQTPVELQTAAIQALSVVNAKEATEAVLTAWPSFGPAVRREAQEMLFARPERLPLLLSALERGKVHASQLDLARREQLLKHAKAEVRERAGKLLAGQVPSDRQEVLKAHRIVLGLTGEAASGRELFKKNCSTCHRLESEGFEVGPDLLSALKNKTKEMLLIDLLDPSREVDSRYLNYIAHTTDGRLVTGLIASETSSSLLLRRADKAEDVLLRADIDLIQSTSKSLMPEGLERQLKPQELADVIAYLLEAAARK